MIKTIWRIFWLAPFLLLSSCYIPHGYLTKIQISKDGRYSLNFEGYILASSFLSKLNKGEITTGTAEHATEQSVHFKALTRMGFNNIQYLAPASYAVQLEKTGNILEERMIAFPARSGALLVIKLLKNNRLVVESRRLTSKYVNELESTQISFAGDIVIWTDIPIANHNADIVQKGNTDAYAWQMDTLRKNPIQLVGILNEDNKP